MKRAKDVGKGWCKRFDELDERKRNQKRIVMTVMDKTQFGKPCIRK